MAGSSSEQCRFLEAGPRLGISCLGQADGRHELPVTALRLFTVLGSLCCLLCAMGRTLRHGRWQRPEPVIRCTGLIAGPDRTELLFSASARQGRMTLAVPRMADLGLGYPVPTGGAYLLPMQLPNGVGRYPVTLCSAATSCEVVLRFAPPGHPAGSRLRSADTTA